MHFIWNLSESSAFLTVFTVVLKGFIWLCCISENSVYMLFQVSLQIQTF